MKGRTKKTNQTNKSKKTIWKEEKEKSNNNKK